jgi:hypothetical protein
LVAGLGLFPRAENAAARLKVLRVPTRCDSAPALEVAGIEQREAPIIFKAGLPHSLCPGKPHGGERSADCVLLRPGETVGFVDPLGEMFIGQAPSGSALIRAAIIRWTLPNPLLISVDSRRICRTVNAYAARLTGVETRSG